MFDLFNFIDISDPRGAIYRAPEDEFPFMIVVTANILNNVFAFQCFYIYS